MMRCSPRCRDKLPAAVQPVARSRTSPAGGFRARSCRSNGDTSTGRPRKCAWSRHDEESGGAGVSLHRYAAHAHRTAQWAAHEALLAQGDGVPLRVPAERPAHQELSGAWASACLEAGYPGQIPHDFRRSAVRNMERAGLSRSVAMQLTGHKTEAVYRRYAITSEADLREGVDRLNDATGTKRGDNRPNASRHAKMQSA